MDCHRGLAALAAAATCLIGASPAEACGGTFCSGPSACTGLFCTTAPTQQTGENILFSIESDGTLTTHIQIFYAGTSDAFAWIVPLPSVPTAIGVGTDDLFTQLGIQTAPRFLLERRVEGTCRAAPACERPDAGPFSDASFASDAAAGPDVTVHLREEVGPYDAVVLEAGTTDELLDWLRTEGFDIPSPAEPLIGEYVAARHVFVAIRLLADRDVGEIQPLTLRYAEGQPCVPIRLTAVAATLDMPITAYFLASARAAPINYSLIEPDFGEARLWRRDLSYQDYVGRLIDDMGGRAFVTDYAGSVPSISITRPAVDDLATVTDPAAFLSALFSRGYASDALLLGILPRFLPIPDGQTPQSYYNCLSRGFGTAESCGFTGTFDAAGLAAAIQMQIIAPRLEAQEMLARHASLTRLYTTMDPSEMTIDPLFRVDPDLGPVSNVHVATAVQECTSDYVLGEAPERLDLPNGTSSAGWSAGTRFTTTAEWCTRRGLLPPGGAALVDAGGGIDGGGEDPSSGGGSCAIAASSDARAIAIGIPALAIALALVRRNGKNRRGR